MRIPPARWMALAGTLVISFTAIFVVLADVSAVTATFYRAVYALPILVAWRVVMRRHDPRPVRLRWVAFTSGVFLGLDLFFWHQSIALVGAGLATVVANIQVLFVGMFGWYVYRERPTRLTFVCGVVVFVGVALIAVTGGGASPGTDPVIGVAYGVIAGLMYTVFLLAFQRSNPGGVAPAAVALLDAALGMAAAAAVLGRLGGGLDLAPAWPSHGWLILLAVLGQVVGWTLLSYSLPRLPALTVSVIILAQPMLTVVWGWTFLDEVPAPLQLIGVVLVLGAMLVVNRQPAMVRREAGKSRRSAPAETS